jgi:hypothetical protein
MTSQYGAYDLRAGLARLHARTRMHTPTHPSAHTRARTRIHRSMYYLLLLHGNGDLRTHVSVRI